jgi:hypothetical protein
MVTTLRTLIKTILAIILCGVQLGADTVVVVGQKIGGGGGSTCSGTYGNGSDGVTAHANAVTFRYFLRKVTLACSGTATSVGAYLINSENNTREVIFVIYNDTGANHPGTLHSNSTAVSGADPAWLNSSGYTPALTAGTYWIGILKEASATNPYYTGTLSNGSFTYTETDFTPDADLTGVGSIESNDYSMRIIFP